jgi:hypothetical protein
MTLDEAKAVGMIAGTADNGCDTCVSQLVKRLNAAFPTYVWTVTDEEQVEADEDEPGETMFVGLVVDVRPA